MPPAIPLYAFDYKGKSGTPNVGESRAGMFFAELPLKYKRLIREPDYPEFGKVVYGPARTTVQEAKVDLDMLSHAASEGVNGLRRAIAKLAQYGGTKSHPSPAIKPVMAGAPRIHVGVTADDSMELVGVRRSNVSVALPNSAPKLVMQRVIDIVADLLSCAVDSQLGIQPPISDMVDAVKFALGRERANVPINESGISQFVVPMIQAMHATLPWSTLVPVDPETDDGEVIRCFIHQFLDKCRQADQVGEKKQLKRMRKEARKRKTTSHTVFVTNLPRESTDDELFALFNSGLPGFENPIYKVDIPREDGSEAPRSKGFGFVVCRSRKATNAVLEKHEWELGGRVLYVAPRTQDSVEEDGSPSRKRLKANSLQFRLPSEWEEAITRLVTRNPGCNVSQLPDMLQLSLSDTDQALDPQRYGFRNLTHALQSVPTIYLELANGGSVKRPVYFAYPK